MNRGGHAVIAVLAMLIMTTACRTQNADPYETTGPGGVRLGMTRMEVVQVMLDDVQLMQMSGQAKNPYATRYINNLRDQPLEVMYYYSMREEPDDMVSEEELVPIILKDDAVIGWGWETLEEMVGGRPGPGK
jgi:hypothetical protein